MGRGRAAVVASVALAAVILCGCGPDLPRHAVIHDSEEAARVVAGAEAEIVFEAPQDVPPIIVQDYILVPGDRLDVQLHGFPETARQGIPIDPDGHLHYLTVRNIPAAGKTVAELRELLAERLEELYHDPLPVVQPVAPFGHQYYVLGTVGQAGAFPMVRPVRILDAIAEAGGVASGLEGGRTVQIVDLERSFLLRDGQFLPVDLHALVHEGDLRYNILLHPRDLLFFTSSLGAEIYVFGKVRGQGPIPYRSGMTVMGVLARSGWLVEEANRSQVVVVRGNINRPHVFVVDVNRILAARAPDFQLRPGDIVYVPERPYEYLRDLAFAAIRAFVGTVAGRTARDVADELFED